MPYILGNVWFSKKIITFLGAFALTFSWASAIGQEGNTESDSIEEVIVTGIKASLLDAINKKKNASDIRDIINAEDVGKLPDQNVAEALQRITGVQIGRDFGEGQEISVRGLSQNRVELNGQTQVGTGASRSVGTFSSLPAEMFSSLEVIKTPSADEVEGSLGAIIRLNTRRPLSHNKLSAWGALESKYTDRSGKSTPKGNIYVANQWRDTGSGDFGASINISYHDRSPRQDYLRLNGWSPQNGHGLDLDGNGIVDEAMVENDDKSLILQLNDAAFKPLQTKIAANQQYRTDSSVKMAFDWVSEAGSEWNLDLNYSRGERRDSRYQYTASINGRQFAPRGNNPGDFVDTVFTENQTAIASTIGALRANGSLVRGMGLNFQASRNPYEGITKSFLLKNERQINDRLLMKTQLAGSWGDQTQDQIFATVVTPWAQLPRLTYDFASGTDIPNIIMYDRVAQLTEENRIDFTRYEQHLLNGVSYQNQYESNSDKSLKVDFDYETDWDTVLGDVNLIEFGFRSAIRLGERSRDKVQDSRNSATDGTLGGLMLTQFEEVFPGRVVTMPYTDLLDGATGDFPKNYIAIDADWMMDMGDEMMNTGGSVQVPEETWGYDTDERSNAVYVKANFSGFLDDGFNGVSYEGNIGLRYVRTQQIGNAFRLLDDEPIPDTGDTNYNNLLPNFLVTFSLIEDELLLRIGAAKKMARPAMRDFVPQTTLYSYTQSGTRGNKELVPEEVDAYDMSLEYYFPENNGSLSLAAFYYGKKNVIQDGYTSRCYIADGNLGSEVRDSGIDCGDEPGFQADVLTDFVSLVDGEQVNEPRVLDSNMIFYNLATKLNKGDAKVEGFELAYVKPSFESLPYPFNGIGFQANYTRTKTDLQQPTRTGFNIGLQDFSENSYNVQVTYENDGLEGRIAYNYRDDYYDELTQANAALIQKPYGQVDAKLSYKLTDKWTLGLSVVNIVNAPEEYYQEIEERIVDYTLNDTHWTLTLNGRL